MNTKIEHFSEREIKSEAKIAVLCICVRPTLELIKFYSRFKKYYKGAYDFYYIADDDGQPLYYEDINVMQVSKMECSNAGFQHSIMFHNTVPNNAHVCAWDKALYVASKIRPYDHYWMIEEDVFISSLEIFKNVDEKTKEFDLVCKEFMPNFFMGNLGCHMEEQLGSDWYVGYKYYQKMASTHIKNNENRIKSIKERRKISRECSRLQKLGGRHHLRDCMNTYFSHVENIDIDWIVPEPHIHALFCAGRISRRLLNKISDLARDKGTLFSQEYIFPTLSLANGFKILSNCSNSPERERVEVFKEKFNVDIHGFVDLIGYNPFDLSYTRRERILIDLVLNENEARGHHKFGKIKGYYNILSKKYRRKHWLYVILRGNYKHGKLREKRRQLGNKGYIYRLEKGIFYHPTKLAKFWDETLELIKDDVPLGKIEK